MEFPKTYLSHSTHRMKWFVIATKPPGMKPPPTKVEALQGSSQSKFERWETRKATLSEVSTNESEVDLRFGSRPCCKHVEKIGARRPESPLQGFLDSMSER